ncbi:quinon protein alcohol dehydrogenase-like superfamily [Baffinella frigidus]|nr:quinon protein alcohol dehydrogenase-like superfamily [Cryptophyta sp. CCMP2293]
MANPAEVPCRILPLPAAVRCLAFSKGGAVLTGHEDGTVRAFTPAGVASSLTAGELSPIGSGAGFVKMHNTAVTCLVPALGGGLWTASSAGSVRFISPTGVRSDIEPKAPGQKRAHNTGISAATLTPEGALWTAAVNLRVWTRGGEWRQSLQTHAGKVLSMAAVGARVWVGHADGRLLVFDAATAVCVAKLQDDGGHPAVLSLCAAGERVISGDAGGERVFSGDAGGTLRVLSSTSMRLELEGDAHPKRLAVASLAIAGEGGDLLAVASLAISDQGGDLWVGLDGGALLRMPPADPLPAGKTLHLTRLLSGPA